MDDPKSHKDPDATCPTLDPQTKKISGQFENVHHFDAVTNNLHHTHINRHQNGHHRGTKHHHHKKHTRRDGRKGENEREEKKLNPGDVVRAILEEEESGHQPHPLFSELEEISKTEDGYEWKETARWVKFEEDVEEGANRWSKPHVSSLSMHSLMDLRNFLKHGTVFLDLVADNLTEIMDVLLEYMVNNDVLNYDKIEPFKDTILRKHRHQFEGMRRIKSEGGGMKRQISSAIGFETGMILKNVRSFADIAAAHYNQNNERHENMEKKDSEEDIHKSNVHFMKKLPPDTEASNILVGEVDFLQKPVSAFIRLQNSRILGDLTEVSLPTRFLFILLGPAGAVQSYHEIGRAIASSLADEVFHEVAYKASRREHLLAGLDEFLDLVTVLPPGEWDPSIRIEPPTSVPSQQARKQTSQVDWVPPVDEEEEKYNLRKDAGLVRTGRLFGGLIDDVKRKAPHYLSDFKDAVSLQSVASIIFIYFASLAPIVAFGGLLGDATENRMASIESLVSGLVAGIIYALCSGQPLTILGLTGPDLVFETMVYDFCKGQQWDYLSFRLWIGVWVALILFILVAFDASAFVCYITRFTEESFATLIAVIFIIKAFEKVIKIASDLPFHDTGCFCQPESLVPESWNQNQSSVFNASKENKTCDFEMNINETVTRITGIQSIGCSYVPNAFFMSILLFICTYLLATVLKKFKTQPFFPSIVRNYISDFAVIIAILVMVLIDILFKIETPKLQVPSEFSPTWEGRGWLIPAFGHQGQNPWWTIIVAPIPALLGSILIFMDQQITAVIVNRKEHLMKKGGGYHLDLLIVGICIVINSVLGIPWYVASTILSINHVRSLQKESETAAPGEKPQFLGIREQRVTHFFIFILVGLSAFMTPLLSNIPMPVLYGVFLYMGINSLDGLQMFDRLMLFMMPKKYQPDYPYLRKIPTQRVHLFTFIQVGCFVILWLIQSFKATSILFPIMLVLLIGIRKLLEFLFTEHELRVLDDVLPHGTRKERLDQEEARRLGVDFGQGGDENDHKDEEANPDNILVNRMGRKVGFNGPFSEFEEKDEFPEYEDNDADNIIHIKKKGKDEPPSYWNSTT